MKIAYICPTYKEQELHAYTMTALRSFFASTAGGVAIVVDDGSEGFHKFEGEIAATPKFAEQEVIIHHFDDWGGLTRSWNKGLEIAAQVGADYACPSNNDIIFPRQWYEGLLHALDNGYQLAGPLSNAPGITARGRAEIWRYVADYKTTDDMREVQRVADFCRKRYLGQVIEAHVNGFFQIAKMQTFEEGRFDADHYYCPRNDYTSKGRKNPTPLMTLNEDELQGRWKKKGWRFAVAMGSFLFHYRAVTRGEKYRRGRSFRKEGV